MISLRNQGNTASLMAQTIKDRIRTEKRTPCSRTKWKINRYAVVGNGCFMGALMSGLTPGSHRDNHYTLKSRETPNWINFYQSTENEDPHPQVVLAFGFRITNCAPSRSSR